MPSVFLHESFSVGLEVLGQCHAPGKGLWPGTLEAAQEEPLTAGSSWQSSEDYRGGIRECFQFRVGDSKWEP